MTRITGDSPIEELNLPTRPYNCLKRADVNTVGDLCAKVWQDLWGLRYFGVLSLKQVEEALASHGLKLTPSRYPHYVGNDNDTKES